MSIERRDYIERAIKQLADALARILSLGASGDHEKAAELLQHTARELLGMELAPLVLVDSAAAASVLASADRIAVLARLIEGDGALRRSLGEEQVAQRKDAHALELYLEALARFPKHGEARSGVRRLLTARRLVNSSYEPALARWLAPGE